MNAREIIIRYTWERKVDGHIYQPITPIECLEGKGDTPFLGNHLWEMIGRDLFTGLKDKNNKDIYEGDIVNQEKWVSVGKYVPSIGVVKYKGVGFTCECVGEWQGSNADLNGNATVIGNIYENPELIKP